MHRTTLLRFITGFVLFASAFALSAPASVLASAPGPSGNGITPVFVDGNPTCSALAPAGKIWREIKFDPPSSGTKTDGIATITMTTSDGIYLNWSSDLGIDAVFVKGGSFGNLYTYDPPSEATSDTHLHSPNTPSGTPAGLSHVSFCYDLELKVTKTATTSFTRTYNWDIRKTVTPDTLTLFRGDSGTVTYNVAVTQTGFTDSAWAVSGSIAVYNPTTSSVSVTGVSDSISGGITPTANCGVSFPYTLASKGTLNCTYSASLPDGTNRTNTASATSGTPDVGNGSGNAPVTFGAPTTEVNKTVTVDDTNGQSWTFSASGAQTYSKTFSCDADAGRKNNTATIRETGQLSSASVSVNCYALSVTKDARTSFKRTWTWTIAKSADQTSLTLALNESFLVNYKVTVNATSRDSEYAVNGTITVVNPAPISAKLNSVADVVSTDIAANVNCDVSFPYILTAAQTLTCAYSASLPDASARVNNATASLANNTGGSTNFSGSAAVDFTNATKSEVDKRINVNDTLQGALGAVTAGVDTLPKIFAYARTIAAYTTCGNYTVNNVASFLASDSGASRSAAWTVNVNVPCKGCSLTIGYWKTHAGFGPQADMVTRLLPQWLGTPSTGKSVQVTTAAQAVTLLEKSADASNGINKLYAQLLGAKLNIKNGADGSAVAKAIADADKLLALYNANDWKSLSKSQQSDVNKLATTFDNYNNGLIGPGHCSQ